MSGFAMARLEKMQEEMKERLEASAASPTEMELLKMKYEDLQLRENRMGARMGQIINKIEKLGDANVFPFLTVDEIENMAGEMMLLERKLDLLRSARNMLVLRKQFVENQIQNLPPSASRPKEWGRLLDAYVQMKQELILINKSDTKNPKEIIRNNKRMIELGKEIPALEAEIRSKFPGLWETFQFDAALKAGEGFGKVELGGN